MQSLIKLNGPEQFLQNKNVSMTIFDLYKKYGGRHRDMIKLFNRAIENLSEENFGSVSFAPKKVMTITGKNKKEEIDTIEMDMKTLVWFVSKFDDNKRMDIVNYAFEKLEEEHSEKVHAIEHRLNKTQTQLNYHKNQKLNSYNGWESASKLIAKHNLNITPTELLNALENAGLVKSTVVERVVREPVGEYADKTEKGTLIFSESRVLEMIETGEI